MLPHRDIGPGLRVISIAPAALVAGTTTTNWVDITGAKSGVLHVHSGAVTGTPDAQSATFTVEVCPSNSAGAPDDEAALTYVDPDGVTASSAVAAASTEGRLNIRFEGPTHLKWGRIKRVTAFTAGTSPTLASSATLVINDDSYPAQSVTYVAGD